MNRMTRTSISLAASIAIALSSFLIAAPRAEAGSKYFTMKGQVVKIDQKQRTLLIADRSNERLYVVSVPEGATLKITRGRYMRMAEPGFNDVFNKDRVEIRCYRTDSEHLAQLGDGRTVVTLTALSSR
ncbi:MAG: hypothetical protein AABO41_01050 [Acidobacteriota bacterium]